MNFPGGSNTRENTLPYKYIGKKSTDFRLPRGLEDGSRRWTCTLSHLYDALFVRSTNCMMLCSFVLQTLRCSVRSFVLQTLRCSVRSFYKLYVALFACSIKMNVCSVRLIFKTHIKKVVDKCYSFALRSKIADKQ